MSRLRYYVYLLIDARTNEVFYVGKGQNKRAWDHVAGRSHNTGVNSRVALIKANGSSVSVEIAERFETEAEALDHEAMLIATYDNLLNVLPRGYALTPAQIRIRQMKQSDREMFRLGRKHRDYFVKKVEHFSKFKEYGLCDFPSDVATNVVKMAIQTAKDFIARWDALAAEVAHVA